MTSRGIYKNGKFETYEIDGEYVNNKGNTYKVIGKSLVKNKAGAYMVTVRFEDTGYTYDVDPSQITRGTVKDRMAKSVQGVGCIGNATVSQNKRANNVWNGILERCYNEDSTSYERYGGKGVTVSERWKCFEYFLEDLTDVDGYDEIKFNNNEIQLDKDLKQLDKSQSERVYSKEGCTFMSHQENQDIIDYSDRKNYFIVVDPDKNITVEIGIKTYCRANNFTYNSVRLVMSGKATQHKGHKFYRVPKDKQNKEGVQKVIDKIIKNS